MPISDLQKREYQLGKTSVCPSVPVVVCQPAWNESAPTERIFMKIDIWEYFVNLS